MNRQKMCPDCALLISPQLVVTILCDVTNPRERLVTTFLDNLQITNLNTKVLAQKNSNLPNKYLNS